MPSDRSGGCTDLEDPNRDAREARPQWQTAARPIGIVPVLTGPAFSLWRLPGAKSLAVDGEHVLALAASAGGGVLTLTVDAGLLLGDGYAFLVPSPTEPDHAAGVMTRVRSAMQGTAEPTSGHPPALVSRAAIVHLRALQALDGIDAGASHRTIARVLFGADAVTRRWTADGELRAQVRYLVRRARALRDGGYRSLVTPSA